MAAVTTADEIVREDISNLYINLDKRKTPFLSRVRRGENLTNVKLFSWGIEKYEDGRDNVQQPGIPEGKDVDAYETDKQEQLYGRSQKFWRTPHVTVESNEINDTVADFGKYNKQVLKKTVEQRRNIEKRLLSDSDSRDDDGITGREFQGAGRFINDGVSVGSAGSALTFTDAQTAVPLALRTPTAQIYVGNLYSVDGSGNNTLIFDNEALNAMLQSRWDALGDTSELSGYVDAVLKTHLSRLERYQKNMVNFTPVTRTPMAAIAAKAYEMYGADLLETDFGPIDINMVSWMPRTTTGALSGRGYFFDMEMIAMRPSGLFLTHRQLEDKGGGPRGLIQSILGPRWGTPQSHLKIDPNVIVGSF